MHDFIARTFGGLPRRYYLRQLFFAVLISIVTVGPLVPQTQNGFQTTGITAFMVVNALLYPYSRFVYESIVNFVVGDHVLFINIVVLMAKVFTMMMCYLFAVVIAPVGLIYLYFYNSR